MDLRTPVLAAAAAAALLAPAAVHAQDYGGWREPSRFAAYGVDRGDGGYGQDDPLAGRIERLAGWMRRGSQEGWLSGRDARRAWGDLRGIRREAGDPDGDARHDAWRRLDRLGDFVRDRQQGRDGGW